MQKVIEAINAVPSHRDFRMAQPVNFSLSEGERIAICGDNGSGKTKLVNILTNNFPLTEGSITYSFDTFSERVSDNIRSVTFQDVSGGAAPDYYQQRYNRGDLSEGYTTVGDVLTQKCPIPNERQKALIGKLGLEALWEKPLIYLSSGELRKVQIGKQLLSLPRVLIIDNPYIGLDASARKMLDEILTALPQEIALIIVVCRREDIAPCCTHVVNVDHGIVGDRQSIITSRNFKPTNTYEGMTLEEQHLLTALAQKGSSPDSDTVIRFKDICISYDERAILKHVDWEVRKGEHWALCGKNGSGKSTLLSLVLADNPMAYACDITLFGHRRGRGESIWDIKKHIGYVSPEFHRAYRYDIPALSIVASGIFDTVGLYRKAGSDAEVLCRQWMRLFRCEHLADRNYLSLSSGEQRLILLVRAFVKSPALLVLDEPFHGLDALTRKHAGAIIEHYAKTKGKTLLMVTHYAEELPPCISHSLTLKPAN